MSWRGLGEGVGVGGGELPGAIEEVADDLELVVGVGLIAPILGLAGLFTVTANNNGPVGAAINALVAAQGLWMIAASLTLLLRSPMRRAAVQP